jgi:AraC-like DNA-binding protein
MRIPLLVDGFEIVVVFLQAVMCSRLVFTGQRFAQTCRSALRGKHSMTTVKRSAEPSRLTQFPTASGALTRLCHGHAVESDIEVGPLLRKAGLTREQIETSTLRLSAKGQIDFLNLVAEGLGDELLGFHLAQDFDLREIGTLYYIMASSETLGDALQRAARYSTITNEAVHLECRRGQKVAVTFEYIDVARHQDRHQIEFFMISLVRLVRHLSGHHLFPDRVTLTHHRTSFQPKFESFFGCDVVFGGRADEITFPSTIWPMPLASADSFLQAMLIAQCEQIHIDGLRPAALRASVENEIAPLLPHGKAQAGEIARKLGMSQRTLARRLASDGLSFTAILDDMKCGLAKHYLAEADLPITTIARLLGYREVSAFTHAFKRWTGETPRQARTKRTPLAAGAGRRGDAKSVSG